MEKMYLLVTITKRDDCEEFIRFFKSHGVAVTYSAPSRGTARQKTLAIFGIEKTQKTTHFCIVPAHLKNELLVSMTRDLAIDLPDRGIAVAVPLTSFGGRRTLDAFLQGCHDTESTEVTNMNESGTETELIMAICENGHTDEVMDAARSAGARGGTVIHAKGTGTELAEKFFGVSLAAEKELIFIVTTTDQKKVIMRAIMDNAGSDSPAHAVVFSLPVSDTAGLRFFPDAT